LYIVLEIYSCDQAFF